MLEKFTYTNHKQESISLGDPASGIFANANDVRDYDWNHDASNDIIYQFKKGIVTKTIPFVIPNKGNIRNTLYEIVEKDVIAGVKGSLADRNGYKLKCNIVGIKNIEYLQKWYSGDLALVTDDPVWRKETLYTILPQAQGSEFLRYPHPYAYDYLNSLIARNVYIHAPFPVDFRMVIYGPATNPAINIGTNSYVINQTITQGQYIILNAEEKKKTITLVGIDGSETNIFTKRDKSVDVFKPIQPGNNLTSWNGNFGFDVFAIEKRSEPLWM